MSEIINRGKIVIDLVAGKVEIPQPKFDEAIPKQQEMNRATEDQAKASEQVEQAIRKQEQAQDAAARKVVQQQRETSESLDRMAQGFMKVSRAAVLLGFAQDESLKDLLRNLALAHAAFDAFDGTRKIMRGLKDTMAQAANQGKTLFQVIGSGNIALAAGAVAVGLLAAAWAAARREQQRYEDQLKQGEQALASIQQARLGELTPGERLRMAEGDRMRLPSIVGSPDDLAKNAEAYQRVEQDILAAKRAQLQIVDQAKAKQIDAIRNGQTQLDLAKQRIAAEQGAIRSYEAAYSKLDEKQQQQLKAAFDKIRQGKDLSENEVSLIEQVGQGGIAERQRAKEGRREGASAAEDLRGLEGATVGTSGSLAELTKEAERLAEAFKQLTNNRDGATAIAELEQQRQEIERQSVELGRTFLKALKYIESQIKAETARNKGAREAQANEAATNASHASTFAF